MTCASCANRTERKLNKLDGVTATVNYATEKARVEYDPGAVAPEQLVEAVEAAGYQAAPPSTEPTARPDATEHDETAPLRRRLILAALLSADRRQRDDRPCRRRGGRHRRRHRRSHAV
jgi:Cu+-exporting ATPase